MKQPTIPDSLYEWLKDQVPCECARMEKHQAGKRQADISAYLAGFTMAIDLVIEKCRALDQ